MLGHALNRLEHVRKSHNGSTCRGERSAIGQFLTPLPIARFMASLPEQEWEDVRILDAGAGAGVLFAALVEALVSKQRHPRSIEVVAYENDKRILPKLQETIEQCEEICKESGISFKGEIHTEDFIPAAIAQTDEGLFAARGMKFTHAILNPPYKKILSQTITRKWLDSAGVEVSNLYAAFVWLATRMLKPGGELVAITPRSFCNGPYFRRFRAELLDTMSLRRIHLFQSRKKAFGDDDVLQENIIYHTVRSTQKPESVTISSSEGTDFDNANIRSVSYESVVLPGDPDTFIHLMADEADNRVMERMERFSSTLSDLGMDVSTGRIVDFRVRECLRSLPEQGAMPLIYPCHFQNGFINWPLIESKKPNAIVNSEITRELLVPAGYYVLTRRFSAKEEPRRVVAAIYVPGRVTAPLVGFENHLNYFHAGGKGLDEKLANGLTLYLNSTLFDRYFRLFSGHTQVNVTDLRKMKYPDREQLIRLGSHIKDQMPDQETIDAILLKECEDNG